MRVGHKCRPKKERSRKRELRRNCFTGTEESQPGRLDSDSSWRRGRALKEEEKDYDDDGGGCGGSDHYRCHPHRHQSDTGWLVGREGGRD